MERRTNFFKKKSSNLSIPLQVNQLRGRFPDSKISFTSKTLEWIGRLQPTPLSRTYTVKINYTLGSRPTVSVLEPELESRPGEKLPHVFKGDKLCLFEKLYVEWSGALLIADSIVPWSSAWLAYYEIWKATGFWSGSKASHPIGGNPKSP